MRNTIFNEHIDVYDASEILQINITRELPDVNI